MVYGEDNCLCIHSCKKYLRCQEPIPLVGCQVRQMKINIEHPAMFEFQVNDEQLSSISVSCATRCPVFYLGDPTSWPPCASSQSTTPCPQSWQCSDSLHCRLVVSSFELHLKGTEQWVLGLCLWDPSTLLPVAHSFSLLAVFHHMDEPQFLFSCWWTFGLFPVWAAIDRALWTCPLVTCPLVATWTQEWNYLAIFSF